MFDYLIVGAGLFGAVFAREMTDRGRTCLVVEKRGHVGGNVYTETVGGIPVHRYGAHIFHTSDETVWRYVNRFVPFAPYRHTVKANNNGKLYSLPFNLNTFDEIFGARTPDEARAAIERTRVPCDAPRNLEETALATLGSEVYRLLVKSYTEKQWGRPCTELPPFLLGRLPVRFTRDNNYFNDTFQGIPREGYTPLIEALLKGSEVRLGVDYLAHRAELNALARKVLYTGPVDAFFDCRLGRLDYRSLRFETEDLPQPDYQGYAVVNYTGAEVPFTRILEHKYFCGADVPHTVITREYPQAYAPGREPYYPVNDERNTALYARYRALAEAEPNVLFGGRLGTYTYADMDDTVAAALALAAREFAKE